MTSESGNRRFLSEINVIPLVDVVLVLLVIFMVTAPMLHRGLDITLPTSSSNTITAEERLVVTIKPAIRAIITVFFMSYPLLFLMPEDKSNVNYTGLTEHAIEEAFLFLRGFWFWMSRVHLIRRSAFRLLTFLKPFSDWNSFG